MIKALLLRNLITIQKAIRIRTFVFGLKTIHSLFIDDDSVQISDAHASNLYRIWRSQVSPSDGILILEKVVDFTTQLGIFIKVG
jgi:hypothetical protein